MRHLGIEVDDALQHLGAGRTLVEHRSAVLRTLGPQPICDDRADHLSLSAAKEISLVVPWRAELGALPAGSELRAENVKRDPHSSIAAQAFLRGS